MKYQVNICSAALHPARELLGVDLSQKGDVEKLLQHLKDEHLKKYGVAPKVTKGFGGWYTFSHKDT